MHAPAPIWQAIVVGHGTAVRGRRTGKAPGTGRGLNSRQQFSTLVASRPRSG